MMLKNYFKRFMREFTREQKLYMLVVSVFCPALLIISTIVGGVSAGKRTVPKKMSHPKAAAHTVYKYKKEVVIDPGHGGPDPGATGIGGIVEKTVNLSIGLKLRDLFKANGYAVIMTRQDDTSIYDPGSTSLRDKKKTDIYNRTKIVNSHPDDIFISIHQNYSDESRKYSGAQVYFSGNNPDSKILAKAMQAQIKSELQPQNNRNIQPCGKLYILLHATSPAIMVECGFLTNPDEAKLLGDNTYQQKMAQSIFDAADQFYKSEVQTVK